jgi:hypothetical protein
MDFRTRYDFLKTGISRYDGYYNLAAVTASLLLTSNAIFLAPSLGQKNDFLALVGGGGAPRVLILVSASLSLVSIVYAALVIASHLGGVGTRGYHSLFFTESVAEQPYEEYSQAVAKATEAAILDDLTRLAHLLAGGVTQKFRYINISLVALVAAIVSAFAALML